MSQNYSINIFAANKMSSKKCIIFRLYSFVLTIANVFVCHVGKSSGLVGRIDPERGITYVLCDTKG